MRAQEIHSETAKRHLQSMQTNGVSKQLCEKIETVRRTSESRKKTTREIRKIK